MLVVGKEPVLSVTPGTSGLMAYDDVAVQPEMAMLVVLSLAVIVAWHVNEVDFLLDDSVKETCSRQQERRYTQGGRQNATAVHARIRS